MASRGEGADRCGELQGGETLCSALAEGVRETTDADPFRGGLRLPGEADGPDQAEFLVVNLHYKQPYLCPFENSSIPKRTRRSASASFEAVTVPDDPARDRTGSDLGTCNSSQFDGKIRHDGRIFSWPPDHSFGDVIVDIDHKVVLYTLTSFREPPKRWRRETGTFVRRHANVLQQVDGPD
ncbi:hypothetical protein [Mesorhizobium sp. Root102]|uniref:hypothetical protein n=1 Tax=Mesorhizobium sp. Root102 TaxID=1736422 RepID=UPI0012E3580A|nr:hypothetical protein [Mesorhizobium sp. Root102]